jgi:hypothetical protein
VEHEGLGSGGWNLAISAYGGITGVGGDAVFWLQQISNMVPFLVVRKFGSLLEKVKS